MKEIKVTPEIRSQLIEEFHVSEKTVWNAIKFHTDSYTAKQIRSRALELGGRLMAEVTAETTEKTERRLQ